MFSIFVVQTFVIFSWSSLITISKKNSFFVSFLFVMILSNGFFIIPEFIRGNLVDPFLKLGMFLSILFSLPVTVVSILGFRKLKEILNNNKKLNSGTVLVFLFVLFALIPIYEILLRL